jgi:transposase
MYRASPPRERERWHALWLVARGWSAAQVAEALERDPHTVGERLAAFGRAGPAALAFERTPLPPVGGFDGAQQAELKAAVQAPPRAAGIELADWNWKVAREFVRRCFGIALGCSSCRAYLHRLGFVLKRPKKRLLKANPERRAAFVREYALLQAVARATGATIFFVDEAHFHADAELRGRCVLKGQPALFDSTSPRWGDKASYYSAVCFETGAVEAMELDGNSCAATTVAFLRQLRARHPGPLIVIWDNGPAHGGDALRAYLATPDLRLCLVRLPAYSPDLNADEGIRAWTREEVTANTCFGTQAKVREAVGPFFRGLAGRTEEVKRRCRTVLQARAAALASVADALVPHPSRAVPTVALV